MSLSTMAGESVGFSVGGIDYRIKPATLGQMARFDQMARERYEKEWSARAVEYGRALRDIGTNPATIVSEMRAASRYTTEYRSELMRSFEGQLLFMRMVFEDNSLDPGIVDNVPVQELDKITVAVLGVDGSDDDEPGADSDPTGGAAGTG